MGVETRRAAAAAGSASPRLIYRHYVGQGMKYSSPAPGAQVPVHSPPAMVQPGERGSEPECLDNLYLVKRSPLTLF